MSSTTASVATRITTAELTWLLSLRPGLSTALVAVALGLEATSIAHPIEPAELDRLVAAGRAHDRRGEILPRGESAVVGDVLTSASALVSVGTGTGLAALLAVGRDRLLVVAPAPGGVEVAALEAGTSPGSAIAALASRVGSDADVVVAVPGGEVTEVETGDGVADRIDGLLP